MKIEFDKKSMLDIGFACQIETPEEIDIVKKFETDFGHVTEDMWNDPEESFTANPKVGGWWTYDLFDLHALAQSGVKLNGLPEWLIIK